VGGVIAPGHDRVLPAGAALAAAVRRECRFLAQEAYGQMLRRGFDAAIDLSAHEKRVYAAFRHHLDVDATGGFHDARQRYAGSPDHWAKVTRGYYFKGPGRPWTDLDDVVDALAYRLSAETVRDAGVKATQAVRELKEALKASFARREGIGKLTKRIEAIVPDKAKARRIARTESARAFHHGQLVAARRAGYRGKRWVAEAGACELCRKLHRTVVDLLAPFTVIVPPAHPNCQCTWAEVE
jgi:SPP1 gp7 family putative phage head morphogenesis protein